MNVASLELCRELYELSGWNNTKFSYFNGVGGWRFDWDETESSMYKSDEKGSWLPAYDLGYLLRKLPMTLKLEHSKQGKEYWCCGVFLPGKLFSATADTPEDATAKLAIELFKQGILLKESK